MWCEHLRKSQILYLLQIAGMLDTLPVCWVLMPPRDSRKESMLSPLRSERESSVVYWQIFFFNLSVRAEGGEEYPFLPPPSGLPALKPLCPQPGRSQISMLPSVVDLASGGDVAQTLISGCSNVMLQALAPGLSSVLCANPQHFHFPVFSHASCPSSEQVGRWVVVGNSQVRQPQAWNHQ